MSFLIQLFRLAIHRRKDKEDYFRFQKLQASHVIATLKEILGLDSNISIIDFGCGRGGYSYILAKEFKEVVAVDFFCDPVRKNFAGMNNIRFETGDLVTYRGKRKDLLFCASVIEHIPKEKQFVFIQNIKENIEPGGYLYLSFPPFKSIIGGHACSPFHYFPDKISFYLTKKIKKRAISSYETMYGNWGVCKTGIKEVERLLRENEFEIIQIRARYMPLWYSKWFNKNEYLNWHVEFFCRKGGEG